QEHPHRHTDGGRTGGDGCRLLAHGDDNGPRASHLLADAIDACVCRIDDTHGFRLRGERSRERFMASSIVVAIFDAGRPAMESYTECYDALYDWSRRCSWSWHSTPRAQRRRKNTRRRSLKRLRPISSNRRFAIFWTPRPCK